jgi:LmbE family N-acetylglucosaminyl deacetylase
MLDILSFKRILIVVAHPDDEVLGCGGTIAKFSAGGRKVHVLILGGVTTSRYKNKAEEENWKEKAFKGEADKTAGIFGVASLTRCNFPDNRFDTVPFLEIIKSVEKLKDRIKPDFILTHDYSDLNIDHRLTHQAVITAFRPEPGHKCAGIAAFEILSSTEFQDPDVTDFKPNCYVDIAKYMTKKIEAMKCYKSELKKFPHPRSLKGIKYLARKRGMEVCLEYAEAFRVIRMVY